jgi:hypothetical protein
MGSHFIALLFHVFAMVTLFASFVSTFTPLAALQQKTYNSQIIGDPSIHQRPCSTARHRHRAAVNDNVNSENPVQVFDNVVSPVVANVLHYLAFEQSLRSNGDTCLFVRPPYNTKPLTPLEHFIDSVLTTSETPASADCRVVEYWSREEYMNIKAHVDIDENALHYGRLDCPEASHILYLSVQDGLKGPTCIFPTEKGSWTTATTTDKEGVVNLITVPAVPGRMVKLPGNAMHAVPCPPTRWLLGKEDERTLTLLEDEEEDSWDDEEEDEEDDEEAEDDEDGKAEELDDEDDEDEIERSVLLFNTWAGDGPQGVKGDYADIWPDGIGLDNGNSKAKVLVEEWQEDYGISAERIHCLPKSDWKETFVYEADEEASSSSKEQLRIPLMGDGTRRGVPNETVVLQVPVGALQDAVDQESRATRLRLLN